MLVAFVFFCCIMVMDLSGAKAVYPCVVAHCIGEALLVFICFEHATQTASVTTCVVSTVLGRGWP